MRIWQVPFGELDNQRVLGQHNEIHGLHTLIVKQRRPWGGLRREDEAYIHHVHQLTLQEATFRPGWTMGQNHQSELPWLTEETELYHPARDTQRLLEEIKPLRDRRRVDRWHLWLRWGGVYRGRVTKSDGMSWEALEDYRAHAVRYREQGGCRHDGPIELGEGSQRGLELCLLCKQAVREIQGDGVWHRRGWSRNG
jgi:hypothetical protein